MNLALDVAGIPIELPGWTKVVAYLFLALFAVAISVAIWQTIVKAKDRTQLGEIHAKTNLILLILRGFQNESHPDQVDNEHYAPEEITDQHERVNP